MLLQELKLHNIRSYLDETIRFPEGSLLLSGDIGSGKSTILLAIEFALFGASRTELPAEALLRKGAARGEVELTFLLGGKTMTIKRGLKKERQAITQTVGYIITGDASGDVKKELTPVEMKAEIISRLGYPEEYLSKTKNYLFRYTVYTPQEEMKEILQEDEEIRLDILRKIFQVDKYKIIRENLHFYLKQMRTQMAVLKTRLEPFEEVRKQLEELEREKEELIKSWQEREPELRELKETVGQKEAEREKKEEEQQAFLRLRHEFQMIAARLEEKKLQERSLGRQREKIDGELAGLALPPERSREEIGKEKKELEERKNLILAERSGLQEKTAYLQRLIREEEKEIGKLQAEISQIPAKEEKIALLSRELALSEDLPEKKARLEELFHAACTSIAHNETLLSQSKELGRRIAELDTCPTCRQEVSGEHKQKIIEEEKGKTARIESLLFEFSKQRCLILEQRKEVERKIRERIDKENCLARLGLELGQLQRKIEEGKRKEEQLSSWIKEKDDARKKLVEIEEQNFLQLMMEKLAGCQEWLDRLLKKEHLEKQRQEIIREEEEAQEQIAGLDRQSQDLRRLLAARKDLSGEIAQLRKELNESREKEKVLAVGQAQLAARKEAREREGEKLRQQLDNLRKEKEKLVKCQELYDWLNGHFLELAGTIERQVMTNIHHFFNQLFQEWFAILIDDENVSSQLDSSFYPLIEQNGYEVSFFNLSGGEKTSASLAYRLALNRVINDVVHEVKTKELLILDEPTDGFSSEQLDKVRDVLEKLGLRQMIIVSHESKIESFVENVIRIEKEGHVSRVG